MATCTQSFVFDESAHVYTLESGVRIPSVTQVLKRAGWVNFDQINKDVLENKRNIGAAVHACTQYLDEGDLDETTIQPAWVPYVEAWKRFKDESNVEVLAVEQRFVGQVNGMPYGATFDRLAVVNGRESVLELKCSSQKEAWWGLQTSAYDLGLPQCKAQLRRDRFAIQLRPDGTYRMWPFEDAGDYDCFTWALASTWAMLNRGYSLD